MTTCPHCGGSLGPALFRDRLLDLRAQGEVTLSDVARECGWFQGGRPDTRRLKRTLGITKEKGRYRQTLQPDTALKLAKALHMDPREVGL